MKRIALILAAALALPVLTIQSAEAATSGIRFVPGPNHAVCRLSVPRQHHMAQLRCYAAGGSVRLPEPPPAHTS